MSGSSSQGVLRGGKSWLYLPLEPRVFSEVDFFRSGEPLAVPPLEPGWGESESPRFLSQAINRETITVPLKIHMGTFLSKINKTAILTSSFLQTANSLITSVPDAFPSKSLKHCYFV